MITRNLEFLHASRALFLFVVAFSLLLLSFLLPFLSGSSVTVSFFLLGFFFGFLVFCSPFPSSLYFATFLCFFSRFFCRLFWACLLYWLCFVCLFFALPSAFSLSFFVTDFCLSLKGNLQVSRHNPSLVMITLYGLYVLSYSFELWTEFMEAVTFNVACHNTWTKSYLLWPFEWPDVVGRQRGSARLMPLKNENISNLQRGPQNVTNDPKKIPPAPLRLSRACILPGRLKAPAKQSSWAHPLPCEPSSRTWAPTPWCRPCLPGQTKQKGV